MEWNPDSYAANARFVSDLGNAVKGFRKAVDDPDKQKEPEQIAKSEQEDAIEGQATREKEKT